LIPRQPSPQRRPPFEQLLSSAPQLPHTSLANHQSSPTSPPAPLIPQSIRLFHDGRDVKQWEYHFLLPPPQQSPERKHVPHRSSFPVSPPKLKVTVILPPLQPQLESSP